MTENTEVPDLRGIFVIGWIIEGIVFGFSLNPFGIWNGPHQVEIIANLQGSAIFFFFGWTFFTILLWPTKEETRVHTNTRNEKP